MKKFRYVDSEVFTKTPESEKREATSWWPRAAVAVAAIAAAAAIVIAALVVCGGARGASAPMVPPVAPAIQPAAAAESPWLQTLTVARTAEGVVVTFFVSPDFPRNRDIIAVCESGGESGRFRPDQEGIYCLLVEGGEITAGRAAVISGDEIHGGWVEVE